MHHLNPLIFVDNAGDLVFPSVTYFDENGGNNGVPFKLSPRSVKVQVKGDLIMKIGFVGVVDALLLNHLQGSGNHHGKLLMKSSIVPR